MKATAATAAPLPRLVVISEGSGGNAIPETLRAMAGGPPCMVLIREKRLQGRELFSLAQKARREQLPAGSRLLVTERLDIAQAAGLDGVHLPEEACPLERLRAVAPKLLCGRSVHSTDTALEAEAAGADYLFFSPVYDTPSKRRYGPPQGTAALREACRAVTIPVYALGGITLERVAECMECGAWGIAAISLFSEPERLRSILETIHRTTG
ncbi:thiamine phosphate synthase [Chlorobium sp. N1]|uniref:thiamine phosphate synthase n=1 Tax=Chlorobium sp. N1 TaxID=2491138 RepID=UPI00103BA5EE|nr:thiamine phosphate synthase [Chlorobium sp. N1]TCD48368.1 thiamine phosphate synthase [Chlorobium sp. N1]